MTKVSVDVPQSKVIALNEWAEENGLVVKDYRKASEIRGVMFGYWLMTAAFAVMAILYFSVV